MQTITNTLEKGGTLIFESGTGSGKTVCTLSSTLKFALEQNKKIIYATRTNAQQRQVILELREIRNKNKERREQIFGVGVQGRANMCLFVRNNPELSGGTADELSKLCTNQKRKVRANETGQNKGCNYYRNFVNKKEKVSTIISWVRETLPTVEEFITHCEKNHICPYECNKLLIADALLVVIPYIYIFNSSIRNMLFDWLSLSESEMIIVLDEAHNLPEYIRELFSAQLSSWMLKSCLSEIETYGDPPLAENVCTTSQFCTHIFEIIHHLRDTYVFRILESGIRKGIIENKDAFIPTYELETEILSRLSITSKTFNEIIADLIAYGEKIQEYRQKENKLPRSYLHKLGLFLEFWLNLELTQYTKLVVDSIDGKNPRIEAYCLDPSVGTAIIRRFFSSIHMSGTLEPLEEYRDSLGFSPETTLVSFPSPFSRENRKILYVKDVTTKYSEIKRDRHLFSKMKKHIMTICNSTPKNSMVFFPSFNILRMFRDQESLDDIQRLVFIEDQDMSQPALMDLVTDFKECGGSYGERATLFSVMGGRISEGMDFPAEELEIAIIVGIPYPKPTARQRALERYYERKFRKGWEYTVEAPTARKLLQSIGRLIRNETDRGVAVILDRRAPRFTKYIPDLKESKNLAREIQVFLT